MKHFFQKPGKIIYACLLSIVMIISGIPDIPQGLLAATTQEKLDETNERIDELKASQEILTNDLGKLNTDLANASDKLTSLNDQISTKETEIADLEIKIDEALLFEQEQYEMMKLRIKYMYENSSVSALDTLLTSGNMEEFLTRAEYIRKISQYDRDMLDRYHENYNTLVQAQQQLIEDKENLVTLHNEANTTQSNIQQLVQQTQDQIDIHSADIAEAEQRALAYEKQIEEEEIRRQEEERRHAEEEARRLAEEAAKQNNNTGTVPDGMSLLHMQTANTLIQYTPQELAMLAAIIECEAANQPYEGKLAVGSVVLNRINNSRWPNTMTEVLYQPRQFTPVGSGRFAIVLARGANASCTQAALEVLTKGSTINALFFHVVREGEEGGTVIADHIFF